MVTEIQMEVKGRGGQNLRLPDNKYVYSSLYDLSLFNLSFSC